MKRKYIKPIINIIEMKNNLMDVFQGSIYYDDALSKSNVLNFDDEELLSPSITIKNKSLWDN